MATTFEELKTEIADYLSRSDLTSLIPGFIKIAEARLNRVLRCREMMSVTTDTISSNTITLPTDWLAFHEVYLSGDVRQILTQYTPNQQNALDDGGSAKPYGFTIKGTKVYFFPTSDSDYTVGYTYFQKLPNLADNTTNWLLSSHPDIYLYASLIAANSVIQDEKMLLTWTKMLSDAIYELETSDADMYSAPLVMRSL